MTTLKKDFIRAAKIAVMAIVLTLGVNVLFAQTSGSWSAPTATPPGGNTLAPINVGTLSQFKSGTLAVGTTASSTGYVFEANGNAVVDQKLTVGGFNLPSGAASGDVLTSDANGNGTWQPAAASGGSTSNNSNSQTVTNSYSSPGTYTWTAPSGVTSVQVEAWGAGGGGAGGDNSGNNWGTNYAGGSAAGGGEVTGTATVVPGTTYTVTVGAGGTGSHGDTSGSGNGAPGNVGGSSSFALSSTPIINAGGGAGGGGVYSGNIAAGGTGSGGTVSAGQPGIANGPCTTAPYAVGGSGGGSGGAGGTCGNPGVTPGGGGGGGSPVWDHDGTYSAAGTGKDGGYGGTGGDGTVVITYQSAVASSRTQLYLCTSVVAGGYGTNGVIATTEQHYLSTINDTDANAALVAAGITYYPGFSYTTCEQSGSMFTQ